MLYCLGNARTDEQRDEMRALESRKMCAFCPEGLTETKQRVLFRSLHWTVIENKWPYRSTDPHLLLVPYTHTDDLLKLSIAAKADMFTALVWARREFALDYYRLMMRNGDCARTGATVAHLHAHVIRDREMPRADER